MRRDGRILALSGGVGGAKLAVGLAAVLPAERLAVVVNTGDDFEHLGLHVSPDLDSVMYALAGLSDPERGWGLAGESWQFMAALELLGGESWFSLGDRDLATHVLRTEMLREGARLTQVSADLCARLGVRHAVLPMSDAPVRTIVRSGPRRLAFQDYFVRERCEPEVSGFAFEGAEAARISPELADLLAADVAAVILCPSNPFVSVDPILSVPGLRAGLKAQGVPVVAVSPLIGGAAVKGPTAKMMRELGLPVTPLAVARHYGDLLDGLVIDRADSAAVATIEAEGLRVWATQTLMTTAQDKAALAGFLLDEVLPGFGPGGV